MKLRFELSRIDQDPLHSRNARYEVTKEPKVNHSVLAALLAFAVALSVGGKDANAEEAKKQTTEKA